MSEYEEMSQEEQISLLEEFAHDVLVQYGISANNLTCIHHGFNTTFKLLSSAGKSYAMRINTNSKKWPEHVWAEVQWMQKLAKEGLVQVPVPVANLQGEFFSNHYFFYEGGNLNILLTNWIELAFARILLNYRPLYPIGQKDIEIASLVEEVVI